MSKLSEYSKFDHLDTDSDEDQGTTTTDAGIRDHHLGSSVPQQQSPALNPADEDLRRDPVTKRFVFSYKKQRIYEWEQSLTEVLLYVPVPPPIATNPASAKQLVDCQITATHVKLGLKLALGSTTPTPYFLNEPTGGIVDTNESTWCLEDVDTAQKNTQEPMIVLYLQKANKGSVWTCVLTGPSVRLNPLDVENEQKKILMERYGEENPGFDFSDATVNGSVPDPRAFMGGVSYD